MTYIFKIPTLLLVLLISFDVFAGSLNFNVSDWKAVQSNPYQVLNVSKNSSQAEIKAAYRALALRYYPDKVEATHKEAATDIMGIINAANDILSDPEKRNHYDTTGSSQTFSVQVTSENYQSAQNHQETRNNYQATQDNSSALFAEIIKRIHLSTKQNASEILASFQRKFDFDEYRYRLFTVALAKAQFIAKGVDDDITLTILLVFNKELERKNKMSSEGFSAIGSILIEGVITGSKRVSDQATKTLNKFFTDTVLQEYYFATQISPKQFQVWIEKIATHESVTTLGLRRSLSFLRKLNFAAYQKTLQKLKAINNKEVQQAIFEEENPVINRLVNTAVETIRTKTCSILFN